MIQLANYDVNPANVTYTDKRGWKEWDEEGKCYAKRDGVTIYFVGGGTPLQLRKPEADTFLFEYEKHWTDNPKHYAPPQEATWER